MTISASTFIYGPSANAELAASWQNDANNYWNAGNWHYGKCKVKFQLSFSRDPSALPPTKFVNVIYVTANPIFSNTLALTIGHDSGYWWNGLTGQDLAHEMGHLLGLNDDYGLLSFGNHDGHMMSNSIIRNVVQHEIDDVLAGRACGCKK